MTVTPDNILLAGVVGSHAYGLATPESDVDTLGMFAATTNRFFGLRQPQESYVSNDPDVTYHEVGKTLRLMMQCNPTVLELLWLNNYTIRTDLGSRLIELRWAVLSEKRVRNAYLGYATEQFRRLKERGDGSFSADTRKRTAKHARHMYRLIYQGFTLYSMGVLPVRLSEPEKFRDFGDAVAAGDIDLADKTLSTFEEKFNNTTTILRPGPDEQILESWLQDVRRTFYTEK